MLIKLSYSIYWWLPCRIWMSHLDSITFILNAKRVIYCFKHYVVGSFTGWCFKAFLYWDSALRGYNDQGWELYFVSFSPVGVSSLKVQMPALSPTMEEGNIVKWLKKEGNICMEHRMKNLYHQLFPGFFFFPVMLEKCFCKGTRKHFGRSCIHNKNSVCS